MPRPRQQLDEIFHVATLASDAAERVALLQSALALLDEAGAMISDASALRRSAQRQIRQELDDRPEIHVAVADESSTQAKRLRGARQHRRDRALIDPDPEGRRQAWAAASRDGAGAEHRRAVAVVRGAAVAAAARSVAAPPMRPIASISAPSGRQLLLLVKSQNSLDAIRRLEGPPPDRLLTLRQQLSGGAERLQRMRTPDHLRATHELLVGAWRFAENAHKRALRGDREAPTPAPPGKPPRPPPAR